MAPHLPHLHHGSKSISANAPTAVAAVAQVLGDDDGADDSVPLVERARAEDAKLRKLFRLVDSEGVIKDFACGLRKKRILLHGRLYVFSNYLGYHSTLPFNYQKSRVIPLKNITAIEKRLYNGQPNAIEVTWSDESGQHVDLFTRFPFRDDALRLMLSAWHRARGDAGGAALEEQTPGAAAVEQEAAEPEADVDDGPAQEVGMQKRPTWVVKPDAAPAPSNGSTVIVEGDLKCSVRGFADRMLSNGCDFFESYHTQRGDREVAVSQWQAHPEIGEVRELRFISPVQAKIGPPETHVHETQRYCAYEGGRHMVFELSTVALDVPYGDYFSVECRFDVTALEGGWETETGRCHVAIRLETLFSKKTVWRKAIEQGSKSANVKGMQDLMHMAEQAAAKKPSPSPPADARPTTGEIVKPLAAAKGAMQAADQHVATTGEAPSSSQMDQLLAGLDPAVRASVQAALAGQPAGANLAQGSKGDTGDVWAQILAPRYNGVPIVVIVLVAAVLLQFLLALRK